MTSIADDDSAIDASDMSKNLAVYLREQRKAIEEIRIMIRILKNDSGCMISKIFF